MAADKNCYRNPCANNGTCIDGIDTFFCTCAAGYTGVTCGESK